MQNLQPESPNRRSPTEGPPPKKNGKLLDWVAVKELKLSYHNRYIWQIIGFPKYSNLT